MAKVKYTSIAIFILLTSISLGQNLRIKFYNKTGHDILKLNTFGKDLGQLKRDDSTSYIKFDSLLFCGNAPCGVATGNVEKLNMYIGPVGYCGTGSQNTKDGHYQFDIELSTWYDKGYIFVVNQHK